MIKCDICGKDFKNNTSLSNHRRWHNLPEYKEYQEKFRKTRSILMIGKNNIMYGKKHSKKSIEKMHKIKLKEKNPNWNNTKKDTITISTYHRYIEKRKLKPKKCEKCNQEKKLELSFNHSLEKYTRNINDYEWLCKSCHMKKDYHQFGIKRGFLLRWSKELRELKEVL